MARKKFRHAPRLDESTERTYSEYVLNQALPETTRTELLRLIRGGEDTYLELKLTLSNSEKIAQEIVAMANTDGGTMIFGVTDTFLVQGVRSTDRVQEELQRICRQDIVPPILPLIESVAFDSGKIVVALEIRGKNRPYRTSDGRVFVRIGNQKREAEKQELENLISQARPLGYENLPVFDFDSKDIDEAVLWGFVSAFATGAKERKAYDTEQVLKRDLLLAVSSGDRFIPTVAGVLLFGKDGSVAESVPQSSFILKRESGSSDGGYQMVEQMTCRGNMLSQFDQASAFIERFADLHKHKSAAAVGGETPVAKRPAFHLYAVREALANLLMHRDFAMPDQSTELTITDDAILFVNPRRTNGFSPPAAKAIRFGITQRINPQLVSVFSRREYGTNLPNGGLPMVLKQSELFSNKKPELTISNDQFRLKLFSK